MFFLDALAVEVASPRTWLYDRNRKKDVYEQFGIVSYWIVEPDRDKPELTAFQLRDGRYEQVAQVAGTSRFWPSCRSRLRWSRRSWCGSATDLPREPIAPFRCICRLCIPL